MEWQPSRWKLPRRSIRASIVGLLRSEDAWYLINHGRSSEEKAGGNKVAGVGFVALKQGISLLYWQNWLHSITE